MLAILQLILPNMVINVTELDRCVCFHISILTTTFIMRESSFRILRTSMIHASMIYIHGCMNASAIPIKLLPPYKKPDV